MRDHTSGARLGGAECLARAAKQFADNGFKGLVLFGVDIVSKDFAESFEEFFDLSRVLFALASVDRKAESDAGCSVRQIGQMNILRKSIFPGGNQLRKGRFGITVNHYGFVVYAFRLKVTLYMLKNVVKSPQSLVRNARKRVKTVSVRPLKDHDRGSAEVVVNDLAAFGNFSLFEIDVKDVQTPRMKEILHYLELHGIRSRGFGMEQFCQSGLRNVVFGGSQTAGGHHDIVGIQFAG